MDGRKCGEYRPIIGQAWTGRHVVLIYCTPGNEFITMHTSNHAPFEPPRSNCAETLSQLLSIGYKVLHITPISPSVIQYFLVL